MLFGNGIRFERRSMSYVREVMRTPPRGIDPSLVDLTKTPEAHPRTIPPPPLVGSPSRSS